MVRLSQELRHLYLIYLVVTAASLTAANDAWERWGPYRPNLYFGIRPQIPKTLLMGLMWGNGESVNSLLNSLRDTCEQDDGMIYGWSSYDVRTGGVQVINDTKNHVDIITKFIKTTDGNSWGVQVHGIPREDAGKSLRTAVIFHVAIEDATIQGRDQDVRTMKCVTSDQKELFAECSGNDLLLGKFSIKALDAGQNKAAGEPAIISIHADDSRIWQAKDIFSQHIKSSLRQEPGMGNIHFLQMVVENEFKLDFIYKSESSSSSDIDAIDAATFDSKLQDAISSFRSKVDAVFPRSTPFNSETYTSFAQYLISNLQGGLGYFYGDSRVDLSHAAEYDETSLDFWKGAAQAMARGNVTVAEPTPLLTHSPSRPFFPRGFLWDEGFHLLPVIEWDVDHAVNVLKSWLNLMDDEGWIAREQILGPEARSKVPEQFQVQYPHFANPPTLIAMVLPSLLDKITGQSPYHGHSSSHLSTPAKSASLLAEIYPLLARQYDWFRRTQAGNFTSPAEYPRPAGVVPTEGYRWRGRTPSHTLTSGLDDYPRADPPHPGELHVDALAWVAASAVALRRAASHLGRADDAARFAQQAADAAHNLDALHWSAEHGAYCDATVVGGGGGPSSTTGPPEFRHVCRLGYLSLFPLLLGLLPAHHPNLPALLDLVADPSDAGLWSAHGLRSLRPADNAYGRDDDYWRGAVWINVNVLAALRLAELGDNTAVVMRGEETQATRLLRRRAAHLAARLRRAVVATVHDEWRRTGFAWEQYGDRGGEGRRSRAFTGWTACVLLLMGGRGDGEEGGGGTGSSGGGAGWTVMTVAVVVAVAAAAVCMRRKLLGLYRGAMAKVKDGRRGGFRRLRAEEGEDWYPL